MKLINILNTSLVFFLAYALGSCDTVDENDRLTYVKPAEVNRRVLIEDFTGQRCPNCPNATEKIKELQEQYGEDVIIAVAIHSGPFAHRTTMSSPRLPLCTETGDAYYKYWGIEAQPGVLINRGAPIYDPNLYGTAVRNTIEKQTPLDLALDTNYNPDTKSIDINVSAIASENLNGKLQIWVLEDNIIAQQTMDGGSNNSEYVHQHVFRTSVTGDIYGEDLNVAEGMEKNASYKVTLDETWKPENISVVAFVSNKTDGVLQVIKSNIIEKISN